MVDVFLFVFYLGQGDPVPSFIHTFHSTPKPDYSPGLQFVHCFIESALFFFSNPVWNKHYYNVMGRGRMKHNQSWHDEALACLSHVLM